jgi:pyruvate/2-oxoacid:ferredoxin oxidoreductase beta subunit
MAHSDKTRLLELVKSKKSSSIISSFAEDDLLAPGVPLCAGCSVELALRTVLKVMGKDLILFTTPGCAASAIVTKGLSPTVKARTFGCLLTNVPSVMTGVKRYFSRKGKQVDCVAFVGDGCSSDVGFQPLSAAAERNEDIIYICYDNEAYMNTGIQRSSTTPKRAWTKTTLVGKAQQGKRNEAKNLPLLLAWHGIPYVATATVGFLDDLIRKLHKAQTLEHGMSYVHLLTPCPLGWKTQTERSLEISRLAVESNYFPLWEMEDGKFRLTYEPTKPKAIEDFLQSQGRFRHLKDELVKDFQDEVNARYRTIKQLVQLDNSEHERED